MQNKHATAAFFIFLLLSVNGYSQQQSLSVDTCVILRASNNKIKDAAVWSTNPTTNYPSNPDLIAVAWTWGGDLSIVRGLMAFDLGLIPPSASITSANLNLYWHYSSSNIGHSTLSGPNESWLRRITSPWTETTVTWNNQPSTTTANQVYLPASTNDTMNYPNIDVTALLSDIISNNGYGMMFMLDTEQYYRSLLFASCSSSDPNKSPWLEICYQTGMSITEESNDNIISRVYPNPAIDKLSIDYGLTINVNITFEFYSVSGMCLDKINLGNESKGNHTLTYILNDEKYNAGLYFVKIITDNGVQINRFVKLD